MLSESKQMVPIQVVDRNFILSKYWKWTRAIDIPQK